MNSQSSRHSGIDLLRVICMFLVVVLHILGFGGVLTSAEGNTANEYSAWAMETLAFCAVNCYAMISGFVCSDRKFKFGSIIPTWLRVVFYTIIITAIFAIVFPGTVGKTEWINAFFPVSRNQYWYFTAFFVMFFFIPCYNKVLQSMTIQNLRLILIVAAVLFTIIPTVFNTDMFYLADGYSFPWLIYLYFIGGYLKKVQTEKKQEEKRKYPYLLLYFLCAGIALLGRAIILLFQSKGIHIPYEGNLLIRYTSPLILLESVFLFLFFTRIQFHGIIGRIIGFVAPLTFSVYVIHANPLIWQKYIQNAFIEYATYSPIFMIGAVLLTALIILVLCLVIDVIRNILFKLFHINRVGNGIDKTLQKKGYIE